MEVLKAVVHALQVLQALAEITDLEALHKLLHWCEELLSVMGVPGS